MKRIKYYLLSMITPTFLVTGIFLDYQWAANIFVFALIFSMGCGILMYVIRNEEGMVESIETLRISYKELEEVISDKTSNLLTLIYTIIMIGAGWFLTGILYIIAFGIAKMVKEKIEGEINELG